jgi:membrane-associated protein
MEVAFQDLFATFVDLFFNLDTKLAEWANTLGPWLYVLLFVIVFCETGLVVTPFLPGDSLLFAVGALTSIEGASLRLDVVIVSLIVAGVLGDAVNYQIGLRVGPKVFYKEDSRWLNKKHLLKAQKFYEKYGGKTIIFARFIPIVRTFAPFVAGVGKMQYRRFFMFNVVGAILWVVGFTVAGHYFGNLPSVKRNFQYVIMAILVLSVMPAVIELWLERRRSQATRSETQS